MNPDAIDSPVYPQRGSLVNPAVKDPPAVPPVSDSSSNYSQVYATCMLFMSLGAYAVNKFVLKNVVGDSVALGAGLMLPFFLSDATNKEFVKTLNDWFGPGEKPTGYDITNRYSQTKNRERLGQMSIVDAVA